MRKTVRIDGMSIVEYISACPMCKHLNLDNIRTCKAFPEGIPREVVIGRTPHFKPLEGDNGYQYEPISEDKDFRKIYNIRL